MHFIVYGPEGSGKGTQAKLLAQRLSLPVYTSGDLVREAAANDNGPLGEAGRKALSSGSYVPNGEMFTLWKCKLETLEAKKGFILDGFPRNLGQAEFLTETIRNYGYRLDKLIYLKLSDEEAIKRLVKRGRKLYEGSDQLHDDPGKIRQRLKAYREQEKDLLVFFERNNLLLEVDGSKTAEEVFAQILRGLNLDR